MTQYEDTYTNKVRHIATAHGLQRISNMTDTKRTALKTLKNDLWDAIEGIRAAGDVRLVKLCNPTVPSGAPYEDFTRLRATTTCITISRASRQ